MSAMFLAMVWHARRRVSMHQTVEELAGERAALLEQQERLVQNVSHELRTPVTIARGHLDQLARRLGPNEREIDVALGGAHPDGADRSTACSCSRGPNGATGSIATPVPLVALVEDVVMRWADVAPRAWRLGPVVDVVLYADETWLRAALDALLENAVQHTEAVRPDRARARAARPTTSCSPSPTAAPASTRRCSNGSSSDSPARTRPDRAGEGGVGLGLSIAAAIARAHGGSCAARNAPGGGAILELRLPLRNAAHAEEESEPGPPFVADAPVATIP